MSHLLRAVAALATGAVATTLFATPVHAAPDDASAGWLNGQLNRKDLVYNRQFDFTDYGLTADVALALDALGRTGRVRQIAGGLDGHVDSWTTGKDFEAPDDVYAGSVAKAVVVAQQADRNPRRFGGVNLVRRLQGLVSTDEAYAGRLEDRGSSDFANTIGQAFAANGLARADSDRAGDARRFLLAQQCADGFFRLNFAAKDAPAQDCDSGGASLSAPDTDVTALAVILLENTPGKTSPVRTSITEAVGWLKATQGDNGSFGGGVATEASNSNSTGLAAWALGDAGACRPAARAATYVRKLQVRGDVAGTPLAREKGAIAYDRAGYREGQDGIGSTERDQWRRATSQATPGLAYLRPRACR